MRAKRSQSISSTFNYVIQHWYRHGVHWAGLFRCQSDAFLVLGWSRLKPTALTEYVRETTRWRN